MKPSRIGSVDDAVHAISRLLLEGLDLPRLLAGVCREAASLLRADAAAVWSGDAGDGVRVEAVHNLPPEAVGYRLAAGEGLAGRVAEEGEPVLLDGYRRSAPPGSPLGAFERALGAPMRWEGGLRGVLTVGYSRPCADGERQLALLEALAGLSSAACRNASAHAGLARAARSDALTGCLDQAGLGEALGREIERCRRSGQGLALVLLDLDGFTELNERHGRLIGDELLRRVGHALRRSLRPYDHVGRYGVDEFAVVAVDAGEAEGLEIAGRALGAVRAAAGDVGGDAARGGATVGVAAWDATLAPAELMSEAERALMYARGDAGAARVVAASDLPEHFRPQRFRRSDRSEAGPPGGGVPWSAAGRQQLERLRKRTRQLALANALGTRLSAMTAPEQIAGAAVAELHRAFGYYLCAILRLRDDGYVEVVAARGAIVEPERGFFHAQPRDAGLVGRCLRERQAVLAPDVAREPDYLGTAKTVETRSELCVPIWVGDRVWGVVNVEEVEVEAFDEDDARLVRTVADQVGSALRSAVLYERLERAYLGTAEALAAALEAKDSYTASHSRSIVERAEAVGRRLGMSAEELRALRYGAVFHDIGKIAVPEAILNKRGPLDSAERRLIERHTLAGEQILAPVEFLAQVRPLVRHEHERWDGRGYPDRLAGEEIPLGARVILACDAYDAMTSDRPYRPAMSAAAARAELLRHAGSQFDPRVVEALLAVLGGAG